MWGFSTSCTLVTHKTNYAQAWKLLQSCYIVLFEHIKPQQVIQHFCVETHMPHPIYMWRGKKLCNQNKKQFIYYVYLFIHTPHLPQPEHFSWWIDLIFTLASIFSLKNVTPLEIVLLWFMFERMNGTCLVSCRCFGCVLNTRRQALGSLLVAFLTDIPSTHTSNLLPLSKSE